MARGTCGVYLQAQITAVRRRRSASFAAAPPCRVSLLRPLVRAEVSAFWEPRDNMLLMSNGGAGTTQPRPRRGKGPLGSTPREDASTELDRDHPHEGGEGSAPPPPLDYKPLLFALGSAALFGVGVGYFKGADSASEFFAGYLLEQSLSIDNLFVFVLLFGYFKVPKAYEARVLEYGILGAAILRAVFIVLGATVIERFRPVLLLIAGFLMYSSYKVLFASGDEDDGAPNMENNTVVALVRRLLPVAPAFDGDRFFTRLPDGSRVATPLLVVLICVELSDLIFAVDSIPAVFGVTSDPFIVYSSNMFAIASLRALFSLVVSAMTELRYLDKAVAVVLGFIGAKMVADLAGAHIPTSTSLAVVLTSLGAGIGLSLAYPLEKEAHAGEGNGEATRDAELQTMDDNSAP